MKTKNWKKEKNDENEADSPKNKPMMGKMVSARHLQLWQWLGIRLGLGLGSVVWLWQYQELFPATSNAHEWRLSEWRTPRNGGTEPGKIGVNRSDWVSRVFSDELKITEEENDLENWKRKKTETKVKPLSKEMNSQVIREISHSVRWYGKSRR